MSSPEMIKVLFIEDNPDHAELLLRGLESFRKNGDIRHLGDGEAALDYLFRRGEYADPASSPRPQVVILDLRLPKVDGLEVLEQLKGDKDLRRIPVVVLTTSEAEADLARAQAVHANAYVVKPIQFDRFVDTMNDLGVFWLERNRPPSGG